jgi:hypothetical protein
MANSEGIPVTCDNGHVWISQAVRISGNAVWRSKGARFGPCPECGAQGSIADGVYTAGGYVGAGSASPSDVAPPA